MAGKSIVLVLATEAPGSPLARLLADPSLTVIEARSAADAESTLQRTAADAIVADLVAAARETMSLLHLATERWPDLPVVGVVQGPTGEGLEALRHGAFSVVDRDEPVSLRMVVSRACEHHALRREVARLRREAVTTRDRVPLLGRSAVMRQMSQQVDEVAGRATPVLITGSTGTGKSFVARELHERSPRASGPFVQVSCQGLHETHLESQLVGHRRGAFTGAGHDHDGAFRLATGGTIYIDRVDTMPLRLQAKLHEILRSGRHAPLGSTQATELDCRVLAGSGRDLETLVRAGKFRDDLHDSLRAIALRLPTLRERPEDIPFLAEAFAAEEAEQFGLSARRFDAEALDVLGRHGWPGNVRELRHAVRHAIMRGLGEVVHADQLPPAVRSGARAGLARDPDRLPTLAEAEAELVGLVLEDAGGNKTLAARRLGIDRKRLYRKIRRYGLLGDDDTGDDTGDEAADEAAAGDD